MRPKNEHEIMFFCCLQSRYKLRRYWMVSRLHEMQFPDVLTYCKLISVLGRVCIDHQICTWIINFWTPPCFYPCPVVCPTDIDIESDHSSSSQSSTQYRPCSVSNKCFFEFWCAQCKHGHNNSWPVCMLKETVHLWKIHIFLISFK